MQYFIRKVHCEMCRYHAAWCIQLAGLYCKQYRRYFTTAVSLSMNISIRYLRATKQSSRVDKCLGCLLKSVALFEGHLVVEMHTFQKCHIAI